jgi:quinol monooxygenase YgiN
MYTANIKARVDPQKQLEFEQTLTALLKEVETIGECPQWNIYRGINDEHEYLIETSWPNRGTMEKYLKSKIFMILTGAIQNLCDPPSGDLKKTRTLEEKNIWKHVGRILRDG